MQAEQKQEGWGINRFAKKLFTPAGFLGLGLFSSFQMNKLATKAHDIYNMSIAPNPNITAIQNTAHDLDHQSYLSSRGAGIALCGILAPPVLFSLWDSFKNMKDFAKRMKQPIQNWDFILGLVLETTSLGLLSASFYSSGSDNPQDALGYALGGMFSLFAGTQLIKRHQNRTESVQMERPAQQPGAEGEQPEGSAPYKPLSPRGFGTI